MEKPLQMLRNLYGTLQQHDCLLFPQAKGRSVPSDRTSRQNKKGVVPASQAATHSFERLLPTRRTVAAVRGSFVQTPGRTHTIKFSHLRPLTGEPFVPWLAFPEATHHFWVLYRDRRLIGNKPIILIGLQFDFGRHGDEVARQICYALPHVVANSPSLEVAFLVHVPDKGLEKEVERLRMAWWGYVVDKLYQRMIRAK